MIDLHIHTTSSDGSDEPRDILIKAQQSSLKYISITDHDTIGAYKKLREIKTSNYFDGKIIPGCEFSVAYNGKPIEVLGYGIDLDAICSTGIVSDERFLERENEYLKKLMSVCKNLNVKYSDNLSIKSGKYFATQVMHSNLRKYPENEKHFTKKVWESVNAFYRTCVNNEDSPFFLDQMRNYPTVQEAAGLIKKAGGKAFLAHLYGYFVENHEEFLNSIVSLNALDGIECYHSLHTINTTKYLLNYCKKLNLYVSGGSDYHGILKPNVKIGESISGTKIPYEILNKWLPGNIL
ncbi:MAG: metal-dependent phosphoesterase [Clostridiales bacterium GWB2_37_7]|nr:MAG: metal-dependent phosphoesterase [Clostridiales bacterium GWB2_37_7]